MLLAGLGPFPVIIPPRMIHNLQAALTISLWLTTVATAMPCNGNLMLASAAVRSVLVAS